MAIIIEDFNIDTSQRMNSFYFSELNSANYFPTIQMQQATFIGHENQIAFLEENQPTTPIFRPIAETNLPEGYYASNICLSDPTRSTQDYEEHDIQYRPRKVIKTTTDSSLSVQIPNYRTKPSPKLQKEKSLETDEEALEFFSSLKYRKSFTYESVCITQEVTVKEMNKIIENIHNDEAKNFLKVLGDHFFDFLVDKRIVLPNQLRRDSLNSIQTWNALFNPEQRAKFTTKTGPIKKLIKELEHLKDEIPPQKWIMHFLRFLKEFDPKVFRDQENIRIEERRLLYEMLSRVVKEAGSLLFDMATLFGNNISKGISVFNLVKVHRSKVIFKFSTGSPAEDEQLTKMMNGYLIKSAELGFTAAEYSEPESELELPKIDELILSTNGTTTEITSNSDNLFPKNQFQGFTSDLPLPNICPYLSFEEGFQITDDQFPVLDEFDF